MKYSYVKLDMKHADYEATVERLREEFNEVTAGNELGSGIVNKANTAVWFKVAADTIIEGAVLLDQASGEDGNRVQEEVNSEAWSGPRERVQGTRALQLGV